MVFQRTKRPPKFGKKCLLRPGLKPKLSKSVRQKSEMSAGSSRVRESSSTTTTKTGGAEVAVVRLHQLATRVGQIRKCFMILAKTSKTLLNMAYRTPLRMALGLWKLATKCSCSTAGCQTAHLRSSRRRMWILVVAWSGLPRQQSVHLTFLRFP